MKEPSRAGGSRETEASDLWKSEAFITRTCHTVCVCVLYIVSFVYDPHKALDLILL